MTDPATLTDDDLEFLHGIAPILADRARAKRAGFVEAADPKFAPYEQRAVSYKNFMKFLEDDLHPLLLVAAVRISRLERDVADLNQRPANGAPGVEYAGVHMSNKQYRRGQLVTRSGGLWLALNDNLDAVPGTSPSWKLVVKSGGA